MEEASTLDPQINVDCEQALLNKVACSRSHKISNNSQNPGQLRAKTIKAECLVENGVLSEVVVRRTAMN